MHMDSYGTSKTRSFAVTPPPAYAVWSLVALGIVLPFVAIVGVLMRSPSQGNLLHLLPVFVIVTSVACLVFAAIRRRSVELSAGVLDVRAGINRRRTPVSAIDIDRARVVDLAERTELRPVLRTNGTSVPGFNAGHFRLRGGLAKAFCLITNRHRVLWLPLRDGNDQLLLSLEQPQTLLDALRG